MKYNLESYEYISIWPAIWHALTLALVTGGLMLGLFMVIPMSGWAHDQPIAVTGPMVIAAIHASISVDAAHATLDYAIGDQIDFRIAGVAVGMALAAGIGYAIKYPTIYPSDRRKHYSGRMLFTGSAAKAGAAGDIMSKVQSKSPMPQLVPGVPWPRAWQVLNLLVTGAIGSGKTRILLSLLEGLLTQAKAGTRDFGLLVYDTTGEILAGLPADDTEIAVISATRRSQYGWAMSRDIRTVSDCESVAAQRARTIQDRGLWEKGAATLDAGAMVLCKAENKHWSAPELYEMSLRDPVDLKRDWETHYPPAAKLIEIDPLTGELSKTTASFLITWRANVLRTLRPLAQAWADLPPQRQFSFAHWLQGKSGQPKIVVLQRDGRHPDISAGWISMAIDAIAGHVGDPALPVSQTRIRTFVLDEAPTLGKLERWPEILDTGRNKGLSTIAASQDLEQWHTKYQRASRSILQRFRLKIICEQTPGPDAKEIAEEWISTRKTQDWKLARTVSGRAEQPTLEEGPIVPPEHLADRLGVAENKVHALLVGLKRIYRLEWPMTVWSKRR